MDNISQLFLILIKTPNMLKVYKDLQQAYQFVGMIKEADAFNHLIKEKFNESNIAHLNAK